MSDIAAAAKRLRDAIPFPGERVTSGQWLYCMELVDRLVDLAVGGKDEERTETV